MKAFSVVATRRKKILLHLLAFIAGVSGAVFLPLDNKDIIGWLVGSFTAFGGLLLALMTLAGHSLTLLQGEDWKALQFFKSTFKSRIFSSALLSFFLIFTVILILGNFLWPTKEFKLIAGFFSGVCLFRVLVLPFHFFTMYMEYYDFIIKQRQNSKNCTRT